MNTDTTSPLATVEGRARTVLLFAGLHFLFFMASLMAIPLLAPGSKIPNPFGNDAAIRTFFQVASAAVRTSAFLQLASALSLAALSPLLGDLMTATNQRNKGAPLTLAGGLGAACMLALSAIFSWSIVSPGAGDPGPALHALQFLPFLFGGPAWAGFYAIFLAGICMGTRDRVPRGLRRMGLFLCLVSALATPVLLNILFSPCLPIARFLGFLWLIVISIYMARRRPAHA